MGTLEVVAPWPVRRYASAFVIGSGFLAVNPLDVPTTICAFGLSQVREGVEYVDPLSSIDFALTSDGTIDGYFVTILAPSPRRPGGGSDWSAAADPSGLPIGVREVSSENDAEIGRQFLRLR